MDRLQFHCPKSGFKLGVWIFMGFIALSALKGAVTGYMQAKDEFYIFCIALSCIGLLAVAYMIMSYFKYKSVTLEVAVQGNDLSIANKDESIVLKETHIELDKIHRAWILSSRSSYKLVVVLTTSKSSEQRIDTVPSQLYDIEKEEVMSILAFIHRHNPSVNIGYM